MAEHGLDETTIEFVRQLVTMAKEGGCVNFTASFRLQAGFPTSEVKVQWSRGRHNAEANVLIESSVYEHIEV